MSRLLFVTFIILIVAGLAIPALAQQPDYDRINDIARQMNCPTCVGVNLADCRTQTCAQWRDQIGDLVEQGYSDQQVLDYFVTSYGTQVLLKPPKSGLTLWLWLLPVIALIAGGGWLFHTMRQWRKPPSNSIPASTTSNLDHDYLKQIEQDLKLKD